MVSKVMVVFKTFGRIKTFGSVNEIAMSVNHYDFNDFNLELLHREESTMVMLIMTSNEVICDLNSFHFRFSTSSKLVK